MSVSVDCPRCDEELEVTLAWQEGEWYGTDADGNRGEWRRGHYYADEIAPCPNGCTLTDPERWRLQEKADERAHNYGDED